MAEESTGLQGAADRIRETAKWLTVSLAALGGVLVAGSQLSDIGELESGSNRFWMTIGGGGVAAVGAVVILVAASSVMTTSSVSLESVAQKTPAGTDDVVTDATLLSGHNDVNALKDEYVAAVKDRKDAQAAHLANPSIPELRTAAEAADARAVTVSDTAHELLKVVSYEHLAHRWRVAELWIVVGGVLAGVGIGIFAWGANPPADAVASAATPNVLSAPTAKKLTLTSEGMESLQEALGESCNTKQPIDVLVLAKTDAGPDVLVDQAAGCKRIRFILGTAWGTVTD